MSLLRALLGPRPLVAVFSFLAAYLRHGGSLYTLVAWRARQTPEALALVEPEGTRTFAELEQQASRWATRLALQKPGIVGILCRNHAAFVEVLLACGKLGVEAVLLHTHFTAEQLTRRKLDVLVCDREFAALAAGQNTLFTDMALPPPRATPPRRGRASLTILTSGTTGAAKPVRRRPTLTQALRMARALLTQLTLRPGEPTLLTLPLLHGHGLATLALSLVLGSPLYLFPRATARDFLQCIEAHAIQVVVLVPTILYRLLQEPGAWELSSLRVLVCGSAPLEGRLATAALERFGPTLFNLYGSSEAGVISLATPADLQLAPESVGRVLPGVRVELLNERDVPVAVGEWGRVCVGGEQVVGGKRFETGDRGRFDTEGRLYLQGRLDDLLICGGENVFPQTIEAAVCQNLPSVLECAAVGVPDPEFGQAIQLFVVLKPGYETSAAALLDQLRPLFPRAVRPRSVTILEALPRNLSGKLLRRELR
ncbi:AMP-binding protein [Armatimonas rosea]|uniref:Acyl-CoA synthetase (AMP-forming)/AMP-acid ligase II n=1 Tax=Armatimonas rosea TaxID=685828 RepID=A0A7W9SKK1_ARMRO|nr:AMP-binding protein [Armatimonas rosea]MBB6048337.1 acyl-CoA synthetase (AMP-forming)/AMP-acid ligase II [Armatimonas rosea]